MAGLPVLHQTRDVLREGLGSLKLEATAAHPCEEMVRGAAQRQAELRKQSNVMLYGSALSLREDLDAQILSKVGRLPGCGLPSAYVGLRNLRGELDSFDFPDFLALEHDCEVSRECPDLHAAMEARLGMDTGGKTPVAGVRLGC